MLQAFFLSFVLVPVFVTLFKGSVEFLVLLIIPLLSTFYLKNYFLLFQLVLSEFCSQSWLCWTFTNTGLKLVENGLKNHLLLPKMWLWISYSLNGYFIQISVRCDIISHNLWVHFPATSDPAYANPTSQRHLMWARIKFLG